MKRNVGSVCLLTFLLMGYLCSQNTNIKIGENFGMVTQFFWMTAHGNKVAVYGFNSENNKNFGYDAVFLYNGQQWVTIPRFYEIEPGKVDTLWVREAGTPRYILPEFDPEGNLWIPGRYGFYKYKDGSLIRYSIPDSEGVEDNYFYSSIRFDSIGKIILLRKRILSKIGHEVGTLSQLISFDGKNYQVIDSGISGRSGIIEIDAAKDLIVTKNGELITNKVFVLPNNISSKLIIRSSNGELKETFDLPTPPYLKDSVRYRTGIAAPSRIFEDTEGNIWFGLYSEAVSNLAVGGILKWNRKSNKWESFYGGDGYPVFPLQGGGATHTDSLYLECYGISQDKSGRIWVGGRTFLGVINENGRIVPPNFILDNLLLYPRLVSNEKQKPKYDDFLRDSILQFLFNLTHRNFMPWSWVSAIGPPVVEGIATTEDGSVWIAINGLGILRYNSNINSNLSGGNSFESEVSILPLTVSRNNPYFKIVFDKPVEAVDIRVYDLNARLVANNNFSSLISVNELEVDLSNEQISSGSYIVVVSFKDRIVFKKIIVY